MTAMKSILFIALLVGSLWACDTPNSSTGNDVSTPPADTTMSSGTMNSDSIKTSTTDTTGVGTGGSTDSTARRDSL